MLGQELFLSDTDDAEDKNSIKVNNQGASVRLEPLVEYSRRIIVSNFSSKALVCQVTYQVPTGSVPTRSAEYCMSETISILPYSTWHKIADTFYFPSPGEFHLVPITVSSISGEELLGRFEAVPVNVLDTDAYTVNDKDAQNQPLSSQSWTTIASSGSDLNVYTFLESCRKLEKLDFGLIGWRMVNREFARKTFDILSKTRRFYSFDLWKYGVYHQFDEIIRDLLQETHEQILDNTGLVYESPLISNKNPSHTVNQVLDFYPLVNGRAHPLVLSSSEILNREFYSQYDKFLDYLSQLSSEPSNPDLVMLTLYLIMQDRIGEAHQTFARINSEDETGNCKAQIDYLTAYLKIRVPLKNYNSQEQDLESIKTICSQYANFGVPKWRQMFAEMHDFVHEVERGDVFDVSGSSSSSLATNRKMQSSPVLEFEIDPKTNGLKIHYANLKWLDIKYYEMDIEVMFSSNPFMNSSSYSGSTNYSLIKPTESEHIADLPEKSRRKSDDLDNSYDMIGLGQSKNTQTLDVEFKGGNKNVFVEVSSCHNQQELKKHQAYFSHNLSVQTVESLGIVRVLSVSTKRPLAGCYAKVYVRLRNSQTPYFWKDGYTGLNGVFDYVSVTEGNLLIGGAEDLKTLMEEKVDELSVLILSKEDGAVVKEAYPPLISE